MGYFEDNPEIFAAVVAAIAIVGGLLGSIIGAKIQANGGRDQAAAAREAAKITAEAQRVAALWTVRQVQAAEFIRCANRIRQMCNRLLYFPVDEDIDAAMDQLALESEDLSRKLSEIRLILTERATQLATVLVLATSDFEDVVARYAYLRHARGIVAHALSTGGPLAAEVQRIVESDSGYEPRRQALCDALPALTTEHARCLLLLGATDERMEEDRERARQAARETLSDLVDEVRLILQANDDGQ